MKEPIKTSLNRLRRISLSSTIILCGVLLKFWLPPLFKLLLEKYPRIYLLYFPISLISFLIFYLAIFYFIKTKFCFKIFKLYGRFKSAIISFLTTLISPYPKIDLTLQEIADRDSFDYQEDIKEQIGKSNKIYMVLISAHTMFYDKEQFILHALENLSSVELEKKEIMILLLHQNNPHFKKRMEWFIKKTNKNKEPYKSETVEDHCNKCSKIIDHLQKLISKTSAGSFMGFYNSEPNWRLHIFDEVLFASIYIEGIQGHETALYRIPKEDAPSKPNSIYSGLLNEFNNKVSLINQSLGVPKPPKKIGFHPDNG